MSEAPRTMPDGSPPDVAQLTRRLADQRIGSLAQVFGVEALTWLALPPLWTEPLASSVGFPMAIQPLERFLTLAADNGLVERDQPLRADPETGRAFWISESDRESVLAYLREHTSAGVPRLQTAAVSIAQRLLGTGTVPLPDSVRYWAELALKADQPYEAARALGQNVAALTNEKRTGEAMARVDAGGSLARAIGGPLDSAVRLGNRRIEVAYRRASDQRHLRRYFQRIEQERVFDALLEPSSPAWALHYLGMGGVGKTMLLRHITGQVAEARHLVVSRVDFDHLSPDYPVRRPGQLLLGLAVELRSFASSTHEEQLFDKIKDTTEELHEILGAEPPAGHPLYNVRRREFDRILNAFCDLLRILPPPVVLILDTCEELARVPVVKRILPSVEATFDILTRVHSQIDTVRVIFAGRRPIASAGLDWSIPEAAPESGDTSIADPMRGLRQYLPPRKFLRVHEIRGLTEPEARDFLTRRWELRLDAGLEKAILDRSVDLGRAAHVVIAGRQAAEDGGARYNPFDLALYAQWLRDDETLKDKDITSGATDPYVDLRIVQRVRQPLLKEALPAIVALGRFDMAMLRGALPESLTIEQYADLYRELADYEWLDLQRDPKLGAFFLEVDRNLLPRMRRYFAQSDRESDTRLAGERLAPGLEALVRHTPLGDLSVNHLDAALSILPPQRAARLWAEVLLRVPAEADLSWLQNVTERLIGEDSAAHRQPGLAAGLVAASMIIGLHTDDPGADPAHTDQLATWPDADTGRWMTRFLQPLEISAPDADLDSACQPLADLIVSFEARPSGAPLNTTTARPDTPEQWLRRASEEEAGALLHAGDAIADRLQDRQFGLEPSASASRLAEVIVAWAELIAEHKYPLGLVTMAEALAARLASVAGTVEKARSLGVRALAGADALLDAGGQRLWLFWRSPASLVDRVRLEMLALHGELGLVDSSDADTSTGYERNGPDVTKWLAGALSRNETIDGERLASAVERRLLDRELPEPTELGISEVAERYHVERQPVAAVHRRVPPLLVTLAMKRAALGQFDRAEAMLRERCREAEATRRDAEAVRITTLARVDLACRSRHVPGDLASAVAGLSRGVRASSSSTRVYALRALTGTDVTSDFTPRWHDDWRTSLFPKKEESKVLALRKQGIRVQRGPESLPLPLRDALDGVECARVAERHRLDAQGVLFPNGTTAVDSIEDLVRAMLRLYALDPIPEDQLSSGVRVPKTLRAFLPFSLRFSAPPGMPVPASFVQLAERAHMVAIVGGAAKLGVEPSSRVERDAQRLLDHVGWRRWAELAQDEGELLALRLPDSATRLLELSARLSARTQDHVAVIQAATTARLAASRAGLQDVVRSLANPLQQAWQTVSSANDSVWVWSAVETEARRLPDAEKAGKAVEDVPDTVDAWDGWVCRVVASVAIERAMDDNDERTGVRGVLLRYPGQAASPELSLSLESEPAAPALKASRVGSPPAPARASNVILGPRSKGLIAGLVLGLAALWVYLVTVNAFGATGDPTPASARFLLPVLGVSAIAVMAVLFFVGRDLAGAVAGLLLFFGFLSLFYWLIGLAADVVLPVHLGRLGRTGALFGVLFAVGALPVSYRAVKRWWQSRVALLSQATVWVSALSSGGDLREQVAETQTVFVQMSCLKASVGSPLPVPVLRDLSPWSASVETPGLRPYAAAAAAIDPAALKPFAEIRTELHGHMWPVAMRVDTGWHFVPWEGLLSLATTQTPASVPPPQTAPLLREPLFFYRWGRATGSAFSPSAWSSGPVVLMGSWAVGEDSAWRSANRPLSHTRTAGDSASGDGSTPTIVHAIGTAVVTSAGRRLQLSDREFLDRQMLPPRLPLLVLQQATADSMARLGSDREQASLLRAVAGDMFEAGCQAIIVIPSLPPQLAERVTRTIVGSIASRESRVRATLDNLGVGKEQDTSHRALRVLATAVRDARDEIFTWPGFENEPQAAGGRADGRDERTARDAASQREVAWDLCLFARLPFETGAPADAGRGQSE